MNILDLLSSLSSSPDAAVPTGGVQLPTAPSVTAPPFPSAPQAMASNAAVDANGNPQGATPSGAPATTSQAPATTVADPQDQIIVSAKPRPIPLNNGPLTSGTALVSNAPGGPGYVDPRDPAPTDHTSLLHKTGILRTLLGSLGDGLTGNDKFYDAAVQQDQAKAGRDFVGHPLDAIKGLNDAGYAAPAQSMYDKYIDQQSKAAQIAALRAKNTATAQTQQANLIPKYTALYGQTAAAVVKNPALYKQYAPILNKLSGVLGPEYAVDADTPDLDFLQGAVTGGTTRTNQIRQDQGQQRIDETKDYHQHVEATGAQNADSNALKAKAAMTSASKPGRGAMPTLSNVEANIAQKVADKGYDALTPGQQRLYNDRIAPHVKSGTLTHTNVLGTTKSISNLPMPSSSNAPASFGSGIPMMGSSRPSYQPGQIVYKGSVPYVVNADGKSVRPKR